MKHQREMKKGERKIEDMTEKEIKHLKNNIINQMHVALCTQLRAYDVGFCAVEFIREFNKDKDGHILGIRTRYNVKFSKEKAL